MIELAIGPGDGIVAIRTGGGKLGTQVIDRRFGVVVIGLVTGDALRVCNVVVVVDVAIGALPRRHGMRAGEREARLGMIELSGLPGSGRVADLARLSKSLLRVIRILGVVEIRKVTCNAGRLGQVVIVVDVTVCATAWGHGV